MGEGLLVFCRRDSVVRWTGLACSGLHWLLPEVQPGKGRGSRGE